MNPRNLGHSIVVPPKVPITSKIKENFLSIVVQEST